ncbi:unnamed protein product [Miscanthus lutarioriparius]|uniref:Uncharacterized protein n=1 Tax=Miscanthus lutarioriparius TaxID=422564 RepID=A0A811RMU3_9POAL|nr:unnamed protein product [Miscanthus lutarioriparius]
MEFTGTLCQLNGSEVFDASERPSHHEIDERLGQPLLDHPLPLLHGPRRLRRRRLGLHLPPVIHPDITAPGTRLKRKRRTAANASFVAFRTSFTPASSSSPSRTPPTRSPATSWRPSQQA